MRSPRSARSERTTGWGEGVNREGKPTPATTIVGLGNVLMADDAFGPYFVHWLQANYELPEEIEVADLGHAGPRPLSSSRPSRRGHHRRYGALGRVSRATCGSTGATKSFSTRPQARVSPHDPGLKETLLSLEFAGHAPRGPARRRDSRLPRIRRWVSAHRWRRRPGGGRIRRRRTSWGAWVRVHRAARPGPYGTLVGEPRDCRLREAAWRHLEGARGLLVLLIALHSYSVGLMLMFAQRVRVRLRGLGRRGHARSSPARAACSTSSSRRSTCSTTSGETASCRSCSPSPRRWSSCSVLGALGRALAGLDVGGGRCADARQRTGGTEPEARPGGVAGHP